MVCENNDRPAMQLAWYRAMGRHTFLRPAGALLALAVMDRQHVGTTLQLVSEDCTYLPNCSLARTSLQGSGKLGPVSKCLSTD